MQVLEQAKLRRLVLFDACRDNPFMRSMKRTVSGRSIGRGLAQVDVLTANTLVGFAAKAGSIAARSGSARSSTDHPDAGHRGPLREPHDLRLIER
jgi:hypothetical protein